MKYSELNEKKLHGTKAFPIEFYSLDPNHRQYIMPPHWHTEAEIIAVTEGQFDLYLNKRHYPMKTGDVAFVNPGVIHHGEPQNCKYECIVFKLDMLLQSGGSAVNRYIKPLSTRQCSVIEYFECGANSAAESATHALFSLFHGHAEQDELAVYAALYTLLNALYRTNSVKETYQGKAEEKQLRQLTKLLEWIEDHYTERITLSDLSRASGLNEKYLCRFFKSYTSNSPIDYINRLRIEKAANDLRHLSVTEAAYANGFNDSAYFSKIFSRVMGMSPRQYQKSATD